MRDTLFTSKLCGRLAQLAREVFQDFSYTLRLWASRPWHAGLAITALWKPAAFSAGNNGWETVARLKPVTTWPQARAAFAVEAERLSPKQGRDDDMLRRPRMTSLQDGLAGPMKNASLLFMGAVLLVLLIACTNVASLLIARTADRAAELSIRSALGAAVRG